MYKAPTVLNCSYNICTYVHALPTVVSHFLTWPITSPPRNVAPAYGVTRLSTVTSYFQSETGFRQGKEVAGDPIT